MATRRRAPVALAAAVSVGALLGCGTPADRDAPASDRAAAPAPSSPPTRSAPGRPSEDRPAEPASVSIASLGLDEDLVDLGLDDGGTLDVPDDPDRVGWFVGGGRPGDTGPTVVVGHVDSTEGPAVFARLPELAPGDEVTVTSADGLETRYEVTEVGDVPQVPFPTEQVFGATPDDTLRLITCTGPYDAAAGRYTENRVVTAVARG